MIFFLRSVLVALAFLGVAYCLLSSAVVLAWRALDRCPITLSAAALFTLRILPLALALILTFVLGLPAFLRLEGAIDEDVGTLLFSLGTVLLLSAGLVRVLVARSYTSRVIAQALTGAECRSGQGGLSYFECQSDIPPLLLHGFFKTRILVSKAATETLTAEEINVALRHEMGHQSSYDNFKRLALQALPFPGMRRLDRAWERAAELAADQAAVNNTADAVNLAEALLKLCSLSGNLSNPPFTMGLLDGSDPVSARVCRLLSWDELAGCTNPPFAALTSAAFYAAACSAVLSVVLHYSLALLYTHRVTEWLIR